MIVVDIWQARLEDAHLAPTRASGADLGVRPTWEAPGSSRAVAACRESQNTAYSRARLNGHVRGSVDFRDTKPRTSKQATRYTAALVCSVRLPRS